MESILYVGYPYPLLYKVRGSCTAIKKIIIFLEPAITDRVFNVLVMLIESSWLKDDP